MDDSTIAGELTRRSLMPSILRRNFGEGLIGHSDEEQSQYAAHDYIAILAELWEYEPI